MKDRAIVEKMIKTKIKFLKIHPVWSKGMTKYTNASLMRMSKKLKENNPMHNPENVRKATIKIKRYFKNETSKNKEKRIKKIKNGFTPELRKKVSIWIKKYWKKNMDKHPMKNKKILKKIGLHMKKLRKEEPERWKNFKKKVALYYKKHPEKHPLRVIAGKKSKPQKKMLYLIAKIIPKSQLEEEFFIKTKKSYRFADIAWVKKKIDFEYDGMWHKEHSDRKRTLELYHSGWKTFRFKYKDLKNKEKFLQKIEVIKNAF